MNDDEFERRRKILEERLKAAEHQRRQQQGHGLPIRYYRLDRGRIAIVVGKRLFQGEWQSFHSFLLFYLSETLSPEWWSRELTKPSGEQHPAAAWVAAMSEARKQNQGRRQRANNATRSLLALSYNLYLIEHHFEQYDDKHLLKRWLKRLRQPTTFFSTLSETYAAAAFLKAGFRLRLEDERSGSEHPEFIARHPAGRRFSVEVKTRVGLDNAGQGLKARIKLKDKIYNSLKKSVPWTRVLYIDLNIPDLIASSEDKSIRELMDVLDDAEVSLKIKGRAPPPAYLFICNRPHHYNLLSLHGSPLVGAFGFGISDFNQRRAVTFREVVFSRDNHPEMTDLINSLKAHAEPPATFDGEAPELSFADVPVQRLLIGEKYLFPDQDGIERVGELQTAILSPETKIAHCVLKTSDQKTCLVAIPVSDAEVGAYLRHPETFFGAVLNISSKAENPLELAEFFYATYKNSTKEKLLEFLRGHRDSEKLATWSQYDLAIFYSEQLALMAAAKQTNTA